MRKLLLLCTSLLLVLSLGAQSRTTDLDQARHVVLQAQSAGADTLATSLVDDANARLRFATVNWDAKDKRLNEQARMRAREAMFEAGAAEAKARWLSTNVAVRTLQVDIRGFGGTSDLVLPDEAPSIEFQRGARTRLRIAAAQLAIDQARQVGGMSVAGPDLTTAQQNVDSAGKVSRKGSVDNDIADYLAFNAEMMARRAYYEARLHDASTYFSEIRLQRTRLAQAASERQAALEHQQREAAERETAELQHRLAAEQSNRAAQQAELDRLRAQIDDTRRAQEAGIAADRQARVSAEQRLDELNTKYITAIGSGVPEADVDALRRQLEDEQLTLRGIRNREEQSESGIEAEITRSRTDLESARASGSMSAEILSQRQADLLSRQAERDALHNERDAYLARRTAAEQQQTASITEAQHRRQEQEAQSAELRRQAQEAQRQAQVAQEQAQAAQQQAASAEQDAQAAKQQAASAKQEAEAAHQQTASAKQEAEAANQQMASAKQEAESAHQQTASAEQDAQAAHQKTASAEQEAEAAHQLAATAQQQVTEVASEKAQVQEELERTKNELAVRDEEARRLRLQQSLTQYAATRSDPARGIIATLPGTMFVSGKSELKKNSRSTMENIASQLKDEPTLMITIAGHTDNSLTRSRSAKLSEERAQTVFDFLVAKGVKGDHMTAVGHGAANPVASNKTASGRKANRRVEVIIAP